MFCTSFLLQVRTCRTRFYENSGLCTSHHSMKTPASGNCTLQKKKKKNSNWSAASDRLSFPQNSVVSKSEGEKKNTIEKWKRLFLNSGVQFASRRTGHICSKQTSSERYVTSPPGPNSWAAVESRSGSLDPAACRMSCLRHPRASW